MVVMVVGGNGQLGAACCAELLARGQDVRASVRHEERAEDLRSMGVDLVLLDVTDGPERRRAALEGADVVVVPANSVAPRKGDRVEEVDRALFDLVVADAVAAGVRRVVLPSIALTPLPDEVPLARTRLRLEEALRSAPVEAAVLRFPPFMESWLALVGSSVPLRGEPHATIGRPSPFLRRFRRVSASLVEQRGLMLVPGPAGHRHAFISVRDAARACAEAALRSEVPPQALEVAGPEILSWRDVAGLFERVLGRRVRVLSTPAAVYAAAVPVLGRFDEVAARTLALNRYLATCPTAWTTAGGGLVDPASMTTVEAFLREKWAMPDTLPVVP